MGREGILTPLIKQFLEASLNGELDAHLDADESRNRRNGYGSKRVKTSSGVVEVATPRDRNGTFEPEVIGKRERSLGDGFERQILSLYSRGASYSDIRASMEEVYGVDVSESTISRVTDRVLPMVKEWRSRPLEAVYAFVFMDAIHFKVRHERQVVKRAVHCAIGVRDDGSRELLGMYPGESEGARFWLGVLTDLQSRGVSDILVACIDNLKGFAEAIETVFPRALVQLCVIHQVRNSMRFVTWKDEKKFMSALKKVYKAATRDAAEAALEELSKEWGEKYPKAVESWKSNWDRLSTYFDFPREIRRVMYTTNIIEGFNRQLRNVTKSKGAFTSDDAMMKLLYLAQDRITKEWATPLFAWRNVMAQMEIIFPERLNCQT